jgi:hypothetical protein
MGSRHVQHIVTIELNLMEVHIVGLHYTSIVCHSLYYNHESCRLLMVIDYYQLLLTR